MVRMEGGGGGGGGVGGERKSILQNLDSLTFT